MWNCCNTLTWLAESHLFYLIVSIASVLLNITNYWPGMLATGFLVVIAICAIPMGLCDNVVMWTWPKTLTWHPVQHQEMYKSTRDKVLTQQDTCKISHYWYLDSVESISSFCNIHHHQCLFNLNVSRINFCRIKTNSSEHTNIDKTTLELSIGLVT